MTAQPIPSPPGPDEPAAYCCEIAAGGDECTCAADLAEVLAAFAYPIYLGAAQ